ncbi:hypothetical protein PG994_014793 [Apiospora phragmitis]|uniref:Telomeric single stranded DNA binding POT1/Cdc13 domain-containing protein n=1 Tax=Apiospora phragmitis TaxID=2905665 RepID=A0ABR1SUL1_9PEZI
MAFIDHAPTPIAQLSPQLPSQTTTVRGVVTVIWPYSSTTSSLSFTLAEPEFRLRRPKGQIRVKFAGHIAKAVSGSGIGSGDEIVISLDGVEWQAAATNRRLSGAGHEWQLKFSQKLRLQTKVIEIDQPPAAPQPQPTPPGPIEAPVAQPSADMEIPLPASFKLAPAQNRSLKRLADGEFASPAFIKRAQVSYGSLFEDGFDIFEDVLGMFEEDGGARGRGRKKSKFGRGSGAWRYTSQSPARSPEPEPEPELDPEPGPEPDPGPQPEIELEVREEEASAQSKPSKPSPSSRPQRPQMTDEGCQTMEIDLPSAPPRFGSSTGNLHLYQPMQGANALTDNSNGFLDQGHQTVTSGDWGIAPMSRQPRADIGLSIDEERRTHFAHALELDLGVAGSQIQQHWVPQVPEVDPNLSSGSDVQPSTQTDVFPPEYTTGMSSNLSAVRFSFGGSEVPQYDAMQPDTHQHQHDLDYPPLEMQATATTDSSHGVPSNPFAAPVTASYPEPEPATTSTNPFLPQENVPTEPVEHAGPSSWAPINNTTSSTHPATDKRSVSSDGQSPDTAFVIDNSDAEAEAGEMEADVNTSEPVSFENEQVLQPNHPEWDDVEENNYENEVDAQYSDDHEPEYDDNERGGDYDTRNYVGPNDDEDDSHDEDLRPRPLEPEFDDGDGEEWDEGEDDLLQEADEELDYDSEEEEEDAMEVDTPLQQRQPPPGTKSAPVVIDLLSSDDEDDNEPVPQPPSRTVLPAARQGPAEPQVAPSSPQYSSEDDVEDVEDDEEIISDDADGDEEFEDDISEDDAEDEELQSEISNTLELDTHMEDAQDEQVVKAEDHSPLAKPKDLSEGQEDLMISPSLGEANNPMEQAGEDLEAPESRLPVDHNVPVSDDERETGDGQPDQPRLQPKHEGLHDSNIDESSMEDTNSPTAGAAQTEQDDKVASTLLQTDNEPLPRDMNGQVANSEDEKGHSDALSPKFDGDVASGVSGASGAPPTESHLLNQLDDKLEAAAQQNLAAARSRASENQLPTPLDSQLVDQPQSQGLDGSQDSDDVMVMEIEEVVTTKVAAVEQAQEPAVEADDLATTVETASTIQVSASIETSERVFETQVPNPEPSQTTVLDEPPRPQVESDMQMEDNLSDFVSQETVDDDVLQAALRGEQGEGEEDEKEEDSLQAALLDEEEDHEEDGEEDALQAALRQQEEVEDEYEEEKEEDEEGERKKRTQRRKMLCKLHYEKSKNKRIRK